MQETTIRNCYNCDQQVEMDYCPKCGQEYTKLELSLKEFVKDYIDEFFTFDSKILRSVVPLLFKPGYLTTEYISGKRARYLLPSRMYIIISVLFFYIINKWDQVKAEDFGDVDLSALAASKHLTMNEFTVRFQEQYNSLLPSFLLGVIPVFGLVLTLLYIRRHRNLTNNLIFSFHFFAFFLLAVIPTIFHEDIVAAVCFGISALYMFFALLRVYKQSIIMTIIKTMVLFSALILILAVYFKIVFWVTVGRL